MLKRNILNDVVENEVDDYEDDYRTLQFKLICLSLSLSLDNSFASGSHEYNKQLFSPWSWVCELHAFAAGMHHKAILFLTNVLKSH